MNAFVLNKGSNVTFRATDTTIIYGSVALDDC